MGWSTDDDDDHVATIRRRTSYISGAVKPIIPLPVDIYTDTVHDASENKSTHEMNKGRSRKYRIKRTQVDRERAWQPEEEALGEVLKQERLAWRAESPREHIAKRSLNLDHQQSCIDEGPLLMSFDPKFDRRRTIDVGTIQQQTSQDTLMELESRITTHADSPSPPQSSITSDVRRSCFLEGSMNQKSRATASSWLTSSDSTSQDCSSLDSVFSGRDSDTSTPRLSTSGRPSFSSSIDINEFKPLPQTPSNLKSTIKRIGHKLKITDSISQQQAFRPPTKPSNTTRNGLRRSISKWKVFDSDASQVDDEGRMCPEQNASKTIKNTPSSRTLRLLNRHKQQQDTEQRDSILEERKRKAKIAYEQQFGKKCKKQKQEQAPISAPNVANSKIVSATVRHRGSPLKQAAATRSEVDLMALPAIVEAPSTSTALLSPSITMHQEHRHRRKSSHESTGSASARERLKRVSRSELEKENQQLRNLLRERENSSRVLRSSNRSTNTDPNKSISDNVRPMPGDVNTTLMQRPKSLKLPPVSGTGKKTDDNAPAVLGNKQVGSDDIENIPPVPSIPSALPDHTALDVPNTRNSAALGSAMLKQYTATRPLGRTINPPRPLSMVIEGTEDNLDCDENDPKKAESLSRSRVHSGFEDETSGPLQDSHYGECVQQGRLWEWPEDVF